MQSVLDAGTVLVQIQEQAEKIKSDATQRFPEAASPRDNWRQGDIYIILLEKLPVGAVPEAEPKRKLAPGTTKGSRHCLDSLKGVKMFRRTKQKDLDGPVFECRQERTITHPEHGNVVLPPGLYGISYQRNLDAKKRVVRVRD